MAAILRGETSERPGGVNLNGATFRRRFSVRTTSVLDGPFSVVRCEGVPQMLTVYQDGNGNVEPNAFVIDIQAVPRESPTEWYADVDYGPVDQDIINGTSNPFNQPIEFSGGLAQHTKLTTRDINGTTITNSADDPYGAQEIDDSRPELEITRREAGFSLLTCAFYKDAVNVDQFLNFPSGTLKMQHVGFRTKTQGGIVFTEVTYHMCFAYNWWLELLDEGFFKKVAGVRERIAIKDGNGARLIFPPEPQLLDGSGDVLPDDGQPKYRAWHVYPGRPFQPILQGLGGGTGFGLGPQGYGSSFGINTPGQRAFPGFG